jgi:hypothetical protein
MIRVRSARTKPGDGFDQPLELRPACLGHSRSRQHVRDSLLSREAMLAWRTRLLTTGQTGKLALGGTLLVLAVLIATGLDKTV